MTYRRDFHETSDNSFVTLGNDYVLYVKGKGNVKIKK